jgi:hypothetical protein
MKKVLSAFIVLLIVISGITTVSAYESHLLGVKARVANAMYVDATFIHFGTVFPEEWITRRFNVSTSSSFCNEYQWRVTGMDYTVFAEWKPVPVNASPYPAPVVTDLNTGKDYYPWLGDCLYVGVNSINPWPTPAGDLTPVGSIIPPLPGAIPVVSDTIFKQFPASLPHNEIDTITIGIDVPVFEGYHNAYTDVDPKPSHLSAPTVIIPANDFRWHPDGITLGADIKIQVTDIFFYNQDGSHSPINPNRGPF